MKSSSPPRPRPLSSNSSYVDGTTHHCNKKCIPREEDVGKRKLFYGNKIVDELVDKRISLNCRENRGSERNRIMDLKEYSRCYPQYRVVSPIHWMDEPSSMLDKSNKIDKGVRSPVFPKLDDDSSNDGNNRPRCLFEEGMNLDDDCNDDLVGLAFLDEN